MKLVCSQNIFSSEVNSYIKSLLKKNENYLYLTNSPDINAEREKSGQLK